MISTEIKFCGYCNKEFKKEDFLNGIFSTRRYCSKECGKKYFKEKNEKLCKNVLRDNKHNSFVKKMNEFIKGNIQLKHNRVGYNPDIIKNNINYEVEMFNKLGELSGKFNKWNREEKHILIICFSEESLSLFDECYMYDNITNSLIKLK